MVPLEIFGFPNHLVRGEDNALRIHHDIGAHNGYPLVLVRTPAARQIVGACHGWV